MTIDDESSASWSCWKNLPNMISPEGDVHPTWWSHLQPSEAGALAFCGGARPNAELYRCLTQLHLFLQHVQNCNLYVKRYLLTCFHIIPHGVDLLVSQTLSTFSSQRPSPAPSPAATATRPTRWNEAPSSEKLEALRVQQLRFGAARVSVDEAFATRTWWGDGHGKAPSSYRPSKEPC